MWIVTVYRTDLKPKYYQQRFATKADALKYADLYYEDDKTKHVTITYCKDYTF